MKQVININFQGRVVPIEVSAFDILKSYTESLNRHFANEVGKEEIINDIESRIGELFQERLKNGSTCITEDDVNAIIRSMGRPEEFEEDTATANAANAKHEQEQYNYSQQSSSHTQQTGTHKRLYRDEDNKILGGVCSGIANYFSVDAWVVRIIFIVTGIGFFAYLLLWAFVPTNANAVIGSTRKKLYRDGDDKLLAGVCSGIGNYFGISAWIPRALFLLPFLSFAFRRGHWGGMDFPEFFQFGFSPGSIIIYIILWLVIPEAYTTAEKLEMKGEKVDLNSIKNSVMEEIKGVQQRAEKFGKEAKTFATEKGKAMNSEMSNVAKRSRHSLGDILATLIKIFIYFIVGSVCLGLIIGLFAIGIAAVGIFPLKNYILASDIQHFYAWGTLIFFIGVPIIAIITFIIRRLAKIKRGSRMITFSTICLWIFGWFCFIMLIVSLQREFNYQSNINIENVALSNPKVNKLEVTSQTATTVHYRYNWFRIEPFRGFAEDTMYIQNVQVRIVRSLTDSFKVTMVKLSCGRSRNEANRLASLININAMQSDSVLLLDKGIAINNTDKFRNQRIVLTVYVPVGKKVRIDESVGWAQNVHINGPFGNDDWNIDFADNDENDWRVNTDYVMKADGLYTLDGIKATDYDNHKRRVRTKRSVNGAVIEETDTYRYDEEDNRNNNNDSIRKLINKQDSIRVQKEKKDEQYKDSLRKEAEKIERLLDKSGAMISNDENLQWNAIKFPVYPEIMSFN